MHVHSPKLNYRQWFHYRIIRYHHLDSSRIIFHQVSSGFITYHHVSSRIITVSSPYHHRIITVSSPYHQPILQCPQRRKRLGATARQKPCLLVKMIADGFITEETDKVALFESDPEFLKWDKNQFKRNLKALFNAAKNPKKRTSSNGGKVKQESS
jgi:hypothetical protein